MFKNFTGDEHFKKGREVALYLFHSALSLIITTDFVAR